MSKKQLEFKTDCRVENGRAVTICGPLQRISNTSLRPILPIIWKVWVNIRSAQRDQRLALLIVVSRRRNSSLPEWLAAPSRSIRAASGE